jgi:hypothetical protein
VSLEAAVNNDNAFSTEHPLIFGHRTGLKTRIGYLA